MSSLQTHNWNWNAPDGYTLYSNVGNSPTLGNIDERIEKIKSYYGAENVKVGTAFDDKRMSLDPEQFKAVFIKSEVFMTKRWIEAEISNG